LATDDPAESGERAALPLDEDANDEEEYLAGNGGMGGISYGSTLSLPSSTTLASPWKLFLDIILSEAVELL